MNVALWIAQVVLAAVFAVSGLFKSVQSKERLISTGQTGVRDLPLGAIRLVAACELAAVIGLIVPGTIGRAELAIPLAASALAALMVGAAVIHARLREPRNVAVNGILLLVCLAVAAGRFTGG